MRTWETIPLTASQRLALHVLQEHGIKKASDPGDAFHYIAFDPGRVTGWAAFRSNGEPFEMGHIPDWGPGIAKFIKGLHFAEDAVPFPKVIIYETFQVRGRGQQTDDNMVRTMAAVKVIKNWAAAIGAELVAQQAAILPIAVKFSGMEMPRDHSKSHQISAFNHGWYKLTQSGIVIPRIKWPEG